jgi:hypothetical protein
MALHDALQPHHVVLLFLSGAVILITMSLRGQKTKYRYPPGPKGIPIFGNLFQIPPAYPGEKLKEWGKQYGDLYVMVFRSIS